MLAAILVASYAHSVHPPTGHPSFQWAIKPATGVMKSNSPIQQLGTSYASDGQGGLLMTGMLGGSGSIGELGKASNQTVYQQGQRNSNVEYSLSAGATRILGRIMANSVFVIQMTSLGTIAWVVAVGDASDWYSTGIAPDGLGGALVTGRNTTSGGLKVMRIDDTGTIVWVAHVRGSVMSNGIVSDGARGALVVGAFKGAVSFGTTNDPRDARTTLVCDGGPSMSSIFVMHVLDGGGKTDVAPISWARSAGAPGPSASMISAITSDGMGGALVTAHLAASGTAAFGSMNVTTTGKTGSGGFVMHVTFSGDVDWVTPVLEWADKEAYPTGIAPDGGGGALVTGTVFDLSDTDESGSTFVMRVSHYGKFMWGVQLGRPSDRISGQISSDGAGGALVTGSSAFPTRSSKPTARYPPSDFLFVMRVTSLGDMPWAAVSGAIQGLSSIGIVPDGAGGALVAGSFEGVATFDSTTLHSSGQTDIFVARLELHPETPPSPPSAPPPPEPSAPPLEQRDYGWSLVVLLSIVASCAALLALVGCCFRRRLRRVKLVAENLRDSRGRAEFEIRMLAHRIVQQEPSQPSEACPEEAAGNGYSPEVVTPSPPR